MSKRDRTDVDAKVIENRRLYVRQADRESEYDRLNEWQKKALEMSWAGTPQAEIAATMKKSAAWVSKFLSSDVVRRIKVDRARAEYLDLTPLALRTLKDIMVSSESDGARKDAALKVLEKMDLFAEMEKKDKGDTYNFNLTKNENVLNMGLDQIKGLKTKLLNELEAALERGRDKAQTGGA